MTLGPISGVGAVCSFIMYATIFFIIELIFPRHSIDIAEDFNTSAYKANPEKYGDHLFTVDPKKMPKKDEGKSTQSRFTVRNGEAVGGKRVPRKVSLTSSPHTSQSELKP